MVLLGWISLGFFTGITYHLFAADGTKPVGRLLVAIAGAVLGGLILGYISGAILPDWALFTTLLPAIAGAMAALFAHRAVARGQG